MKQRCWEHDYCDPSFYMVTLVTQPRRNCLSSIPPGSRGDDPEPEAGTGTEPTGSVSGAAPAGSVSGAAPAPELFPIGTIVASVWERTSSVYTDVKACEYIVMPDHFHGVLRVKKRLNRPMGHVIKAFKRVSTQECRKQGLLSNPGSRVEPGTGPAGSVSGAAPAPESFPTLWEPGFQDTILLHRGQLKAMVNYIADNPRRWRVKQAHPDLFKVVRELEITPNRVCPGVGNLFLLDQPVKRQVRISRSISAKALAEKKADLLSAAKHGTVLVSPCISPGEKEIAHAALHAGLPLIVILTNGLPKGYKPPGRYFNACANGKLLMLAPFPYHREKRPITRKQCLKLNEWAKAVADPGSRVEPGTELAGSVSGSAPAGSVSGAAPAGSVSGAAPAPELTKIGKKQ